MLRIPGDADRAAIGAYDRALGHRLWEIVRSLAVKLGTQPPQDTCHGGFSEEHHCVYRPEGRDEPGSLTGRDDGAPGASKTPRRAVIVDRHHKIVCQPPGAA